MAQSMFVGGSLACDRLSLSEEGKVGHLQSDGEECSYSRQIEEVHQPKPSLMMGRGHDHGFAHEAAEEGESRNGHRPDDIEDHRQRHGFVESPQARELCRSRHVQYGAGPHEEERLVEDVGEGMGRRPVHGQVRSDADPGHHVSDLADDVIGQHPADVVFDDGVADAEDGHGRSHDGQDLKSGKSARQDVYRRFRRKGAEEYGAFDGRLRIGVGKPGVERQYGGIQGKPAEDQVFGEPRVGRSDAVEGKTPRLVVVEHHPGKKEESAEDMNEEVAESRVDRLFRPPVPDEEDGGKGHDLPEDEQGEVVAGKDRAQRTSHIQESGDVVPAFLDMERIEGAEKGHDGEHPGEYQAQFIDPSEDAVDVQKAVLTVDPLLGQGNGDNGEDGDKKEDRLPGLSLKKGQQQTPREKEKRRMQPAIHNALEKVIKPSIIVILILGKKQMRDPLAEFDQQEATDRSE